MSGCSIYLSAMEPTHYYDRAAKAGNKHFLVSYLYLMQRNAVKTIERRKNENPDHLFIVDSGAHTLQGDDLKAFNLDDYKNYMDSYADWLQKNAQYIHACVELDVESAVGMPQVEEWNNDFFIPFEQSGNNVIFVWHPERGAQEFEAMCKRHSWVGLAQDFFDSGNDLARFTYTAQKHLTKIHGFGITGIARTLANTFYSVDSTTWKGGEMYGVSYVWDEGQKAIKAIVAKAAHKRYQYKDYFDSLGLDVEDVVNGDSRVLTTLALESWKRMQDHIHLRYAKPTYWDLRPPVPAVAADAATIEAAAYLQTTKLYDDLKGFDAAALVSTYACFSAMVNHDYESIRENPELFEEFSGQLLREPMNLSSNPSDEYLDGVCQDLARTLSTKALPRKAAIPRNAFELKPLNIKKRDEFPDNGLEAPTYFDLYKGQIDE